MTEAATKYKGVKLRTFFATILHHCLPSDPLDLWDKFREYLVYDI